MGIDLLQISPPGLAYVLLGGFAALFCLVSLVLKEKLFINEVVLGTAFGVIIGPYCLDIFNPSEWGPESNRITLEVLRIVLATGLFAIGIALPPKYMQEHLRGLLILVVPMMAFGWVVVAGLIYALFPQFSFVSALVISACLTPTDPIISAAIVGGKFAEKYVPKKISEVLSAESAANDGLAYPFLSLSLYLTLESSVGTAVEKWLLVGCLYQVVLGSVLGATLGTLFRYLINFFRRAGMTDRESCIAQYTALALLTTGTAYTLGLDDLLAAFAAGVALNWDGAFCRHVAPAEAAGEQLAGGQPTDKQVAIEPFAIVVEFLMNCGCFIYIGAWLPFAAYREFGAGPLVALVALVALTALLRRIPAALVLCNFVGEVKTPSKAKTYLRALLVGHFGYTRTVQMGVSAVFVSTMAALKLPAPETPPQGQAQLLAATIQLIVSCVVFGSIIIHGFSISCFSLAKGVRARAVERVDVGTECGETAGERVPDIERGEKTGGRVSRAGGRPETIMARCTDAVSMSTTVFGAGDESEEDMEGVHKDEGVLGCLSSDAAPLPSCSDQ